MDKFEHQGLNNVPYLAKSASPSSLRSCYSKGLKRQRFAHSPTSKSEIFFNNHYDSDSRIFEDNPIGDSISHTQICSKHFLETDFKCEYGKSTTIAENGDRNINFNNNKFHRFKQFIENRILTPEDLQKVNEYTEKLNENCYYRGTVKVLGFCSWLLMIIFSYTLAIYNRCNSSSYGLIRSRLFLRNVARRILWWMTLAKCSDMPLFALILITCPMLFLVATIGMSLATFCIVKDHIIQLINYSRERCLKKID